MHRVQGNVIIDIRGKDSVAGPFAFTCYVHVAIHLDIRGESFFAVVNILVGPEPFQVG